MNFLKYKAVHQDISGTSIYADTINHCKDYRNFWSPNDKITSTHECTHGINNDLRLLGDWQTHNCFYVLSDKYAKIKEPNCKKSDAIQHIPQVFRFSRYSTYVTGQKEWDDKPLYLFDEWVAYQNGAACAIQEAKKDNCDWIFGPVEFIAYGSAAVMAAPKIDDDLKQFTVWMIQRSIQLYKDGCELFPWADMEKCMNMLMTGSEGQAFRSFWKSELGFDPNGAPETPVDWSM